MYKVNFKKVQKDLDKLPKYIRDKLLFWAMTVELEGLDIVRKIRGYNDEALVGKRWGQRSIRLSKAYRAIYSENIENQVHLIIIEKVSKHEY